MLALCFKSNHSEIETVLLFPTAVFNKSFKSNHSGIEMNIGKRYAVNYFAFKSNHSGIETTLPPFLRLIVDTLNRTIQELKPRSE